MLDNMTDEQVFDIRCRAKYMANGGAPTNTQQMRMQGLAERCNEILCGRRSKRSGDKT